MIPHFTSFLIRARLERAEESGRGFQHAQRVDDPQGQRTHRPFVIPPSFSHSEKIKIRLSVAVLRAVRPVAHRVAACARACLHIHYIRGPVYHASDVVGGGGVSGSGAYCPRDGGVPGAGKPGVTAWARPPLLFFLAVWPRRWRARPVSRQRGCGPASRARS